MSPEQPPPHNSQSPFSRGRWAEPYISATSGLWTVHRWNPLTFTEQARNLVHTLTACDLATLRRLMAQQNELADRVHQPYGQAPRQEGP